MMRHLSAKRSTFDDRKVQIQIVICCRISYKDSSEVHTVTDKKYHSNCKQLQYARKFNKMRERLLHSLLTNLYVE